MPSELQYFHSEFLADENMPKIDVSRYVDLMC